MVNLVENKNKMEKNTSSSKFQKGLETKINEALEKYFQSTKKIKLNLSKDQYLKLDYKDGVQMKVQPDVCDTENQIFGEIYTCGEKLLAGQQRKVGTDMLKLLTIEKLIKESQNKDIQKLIILTSNDSEYTENNLRIDLKLEVSKKLLGPASWKIKAIELFGFEVLIYFLDSEEKKELDETRTKQGEKFKNK
jgi:hypothetical protein